MSVVILILFLLKIRLKRYAARVVDGDATPKDVEVQDPDEARCTDSLNKVLNPVIHNQTMETVLIWRLSAPIQSLLMVET